MKKTLTVLKKNNKFLIQDISTSLLKIFELDTNQLDSIKNTELVTPFLVNHLKLLDSSTINFIEFLYNLETKIYKIKINREDSFLFTIYFEDSYVYFPKPELEKDCLNNYEEFIVNDQDLIDTINLKDKKPEIINLEMIYILKKIKEEIKEIKLNNDNQDDRFIEKDSFSLSFIIEKLGIKNIILLLFLLSLIESFIIEPFLHPIVNKVYEQVEDSLFENVN